MNPIIIYLLFFLFIGTPPQQTTSPGGTYSFGSNSTNKPSRRLTVYPVNDLSFLFYLEINKGAPGFNMGQIYGQANVQSRKDYWQYTEIDSISNASCSLIFSFESGNATIKTVSGKGNCGFGYGVKADGKYKRRSKTIPEYFVSQTEDTIYFSQTTPDRYNNNK